MIVAMAEFLLANQGISLSWRSMNTALLDFSITLNARLIKGIVKGSVAEPVCRSVDQKMRQMLRRFKQLIGPLGINDRYDAETFSVMKQQLRSDSNCVDIGCHRGDMLKEMLKHSPEGRHFAFDPLPEVFAGLKETFPTSRTSTCFTVL